MKLNFCFIYIPGNATVASMVPTKSHVQCCRRQSAPHSPFLFAKHAAAGANEKRLRIAVAKIIVIL